MMYSFIGDVFFYIASLSIGAFIAIWLMRSSTRRKTTALYRADAHHGARVLFHLQKLASSVAVDVGKHNKHVENINDTLASVKNPKPEMIVDVVAELIQANQQMHEKLAKTERKLREQAQKLEAHAAEARTDALTLLVNRRAFDDELARRCAEYSRQGHVFSLIMADVDFFKELNDSHGHQTGDEVLQGVAKLLRRLMREMDLVARYGGEEFAIILPGTNLNDAGKAALRACEVVENALFDQHGNDLRVTMSFGVAEVRGQEDGMALISRADKALYAAKEGGRRCVYTHEGESIRRFSPQKLPVPSKNDMQGLGDPVSQDEDRAEQLAFSSDEVVMESLDDLASDGSDDVVLDLPSRSCFCQMVRSRTAEWKRGGPFFSIILIEVHQFGTGGECDDQQARETAMLAARKYLSAIIREMDIMGRYGSGCFALLLSMAELVNAIRTAERLRDGISQYNDSLDDNQPKFTLSIGIVQVMDQDDFISVLKRAEAALDAAERRGGDCSYYQDGTRCAPITAMLETMDYLA